MVNPQQLIRVRVRWLGLFQPFVFPLVPSADNIRFFPPKILCTRHFAKQLKVGLQVFTEDGQSVFQRPLDGFSEDRIPSLLLLFIFAHDLARPFSHLFDCEHRPFDEGLPFTQNSISRRRMLQ